VLIYFWTRNFLNAMICGLIRLQKLRSSVHARANACITWQPRSLIGWNSTGVVECKILCLLASLWDRWCTIEIVSKTKGLSWALASKSVWLIGLQRLSLRHQCYIQSSWKMRTEGAWEPKRLNTERCTHWRRADSKELRGTCNSTRHPGNRK
jgi:hypothetical protein